MGDVLGCAWGICGWSLSPHRIWRIQGRSTSFIGSTYFGYWCLSAKFYSFLPPDCFRVRGSWAYFFSTRIRWRCHRGKDRREAWLRFGNLASFGKWCLSAHGGTNYIGSLLERQVASQPFSPAGEATGLPPYTTVAAWIRLCQQTSQSVGAIIGHGTRNEKTPAWYGKRCRVVFKVMRRRKLRIAPVSNSKKVSRWSEEEFSLKKSQMTKFSGEEPVEEIYSLSCLSGRSLGI